MSIISFNSRETKKVSGRHDLEIKDKRYIVQHDEKNDFREVKNQNL